MALAIDTHHLLEQWIPHQEDLLEERKSIGDSQFDIGGRMNRRRFQLHRVYAYATVIRDITTVRRHLNLDDFMLDGVKQEALDWQADQVDDLDEVEVFHHLKQIMRPAKLLFSGIPQNDCPQAPTTLLASAQCPTFTARAGGRPASFFHRYSLRLTTCCSYNNFNREYTHDYAWTNLHKVIPYVSNSNWWEYWSTLFGPELIWATIRDEPLVFWQMQLDFVDLFTPHSTHSGPSLGRRRRSLNPFLQVSTGSIEERSREDHPEAKRFKGVRYRPDRRTWVAEMKPPKSKNKVSFGDFKSQTEAARAVDAASHHYGKIDLVNFADTRGILSTTPTPAGLDEEDKLKFVKQQAKWLASMASIHPSTPTSATSVATAAVASISFEIPEPSRGLGFRSSPEITSPLTFGDVGHGISQLQPLHPDLMADIEASGVETMEPNFAEADHLGVANDQWDRLEYSSRAPRNYLVNSPGGEQSCDTQRMCMDFFIMSPPAPMFQMESPRDFQGDVADRLLEQQSLERE